MKNKKYIKLSRTFRKERKQIVFPESLRGIGSSLHTTLRHPYHEKPTTRGEGARRPKRHEPVPGDGKRTRAGAGHRDPLRGDDDEELGLPFALQDDASARRPGDIHFHSTPQRREPQLTSQGFIPRHPPDVSM